MGNLDLKGGDDAQKAKWMDLDGELDLFASHSDFLRSIAIGREAYTKNL